MLNATKSPLYRARSSFRTVAGKVLSYKHVRTRVPIALIRQLPHGNVRSELLLEADGRLKAHPRRYELVDTAYGFRLSGSTSDHIQRRIYLFGVWEPNLSRWVARYLRPGDVFLDVGANIGYFSLLASNRVGPTGRVLAFEPVPSICGRLKEHVAANGAANVEVIPIALSDSDGEIEIFRGPDSNLGNSGTRGSTSLTSEGHVPKRRGSSVVDRSLWPSVRVVKVDVEGDELAVLHGLEEFLRESTVGTAVVAEIAPERLQARGQSVASAMSFMRDMGFVTYKIDNSYAPEHYAFHEPSKPTRLKKDPRRQTDVLFIKRSPTAHAG